MSTRWLSELKRRAGRGVKPRPPGRPRKGIEERALVREGVCRELDRQGIGAGEAPIWRALCEEAQKKGAGPVSLHLAREELAAEKRRRRARTREEIERVRESHDVLARDALWCRYGTHLGRLWTGAR